MTGTLIENKPLVSRKCEVDSLASVLDASTEYSIVGEDLEGNILLWNEGARRMYGYDAAEVVGKVNSSILHTPEDVDAGMPRESMRAALRDGKWEGVIGSIRKDGFRITARVVITPRYTPLGEAQGFLLISKDTSSERGLEAQNRELIAELSAAKDALELKHKRLTELYQMAHQFVDNASHEFRTPLTVIKEFSAIIRDGLAGPLTAEQQEYLDIINDRVGDLAVMVNDMLDISKLEAGILSAKRLFTDIERIVSRTRPTLERKAAARNVRLEFEIEPGLPPVYVDAEKIGRVFVNLAVNACKFVNEGGHVRIWARAGGDQGVRCGITDDGPGIAAENLKVIFDRFKQVAGSSRSSCSGFGLGLNIAREIVRLHAGEISVESEVGKGSTFWFTVPAGDPTRVLRRYLYCWDNADVIAPVIELLRVSAPKAIDADMAEELDDLLHELLRRADLLFRIASHEWLLVAGGSPDIPALIARHAAALEETNRGRPDHPMPEWRFEALGCSRGVKDRKAFIDAFQSAHQSGPEEVHPG